LLNLMEKKRLRTLVKLETNAGEKRLRQEWLYMLLRGLRILETKGDLVQEWL
jgi:hypothetical protein